MALPITLVTGFLGSGKTSLIRRVLAAPAGQRIGLLMNERGIAGVDDLGLRQVESGFIELTEGCVCCVDQPDLVAAIEALVARGDLDRIILETTGLADPLPITWTLARPEFEGKVLLDAVVTVVDAMNQERTRIEEWGAQLRVADLVVLTKLDLVDAEAAERSRAAVRRENPHARLLRVDEAPIALLGPEAFLASRRAALPSAASAASTTSTTATSKAAAALAGATSGARPEAQHSDWTSLAFSDEAAYDAGALEDLAEQLPDEVFRAKGIVRVARAIGEDVDRWVSFQAVGGRVHFEPHATPPAHGESRLIFFGKGLVRADLVARLEACRSDG